MSKVEFNPRMTQRKCSYCNVVRKVAAIIDDKFACGDCLHKLRMAELEKQAELREFTQ